VGFCHYKDDSAAPNHISSKEVGFDEKKKGPGKSTGEARTKALGGIAFNRRHLGLKNQGRLSHLREGRRREKILEKGNRGNSAYGPSIDHH